MEEKIKSVIAKVLEVDIDDIENDLAIGDIPEWDSLHHVTIIAELEKEFGVKFSQDDLADMEDVSDIISFIKDQAQ